MADILFYTGFIIWLIGIFLDFRNKFKFGVFITKNTYILGFELVIMPIIWIIYTLFLFGR